MVLEIRSTSGSRLGYWPWILCGLVLPDHLGQTGVRCMRRQPISTLPEWANFTLLFLLSKCAAQRRSSLLANRCKGGFGRAVGVAPRFKTPCCGRSRSNGIPLSLEFNLHVQLGDTKWPLRMHCFSCDNQETITFNRVKLLRATGILSKGRKSDARSAK